MQIMNVTNFEENMQTRKINELFTWTKAITAKKSSLTSFDTEAAPKNFFQIMT